MIHKALAIASLLVAAAPSVAAQEQVLNLYSARHYSTDEALYANFTKATGIKINRVDADDAGILARLKAEGTASPADVILLVDAAPGIEAQTLANLYLAMGADLHIIPVLNKIDLPSANVDKYALELANLVGCEPEDVLLT
uniref:GTP-binding protein n=1 Tax=Klebsiella pneumoniae TaxID=573 RepID=UPI002108824D